MLGMSEIGKMAANFLLGFIFHCVLKNLNQPRKMRVFIPLRTKTKQGWSEFGVRFGFQGIKRGGLRNAGKGWF